MRPLPETPASVAEVPQSAASNCVRGTLVNQSIGRRAGQRIFEMLIRGLCRVWCPVDRAGAHNLPREPYLICANHASHIDTMALLVATSQPFSRFAVLAAHDYFFATPLRRVACAFLLNLIPVDRCASPSSTMTAVTACRHFLKRDDAAGLILFPEGGRSVSGAVGGFHRGSAVFQLRLGLPVVPVFIGGTHRLMPKGRWWPRRGRISVRIGEPICHIGTESVITEARQRIVALQESFL